MPFSQELQRSLEDLHLLKHPFYQAWSRGEVPKSRLKEYAAQYYHHVKAFPRYISAAHSLCPDIKQRRVLLENLSDEEGFVQGEPHPRLWMRFIEGLGLNPQEAEKTAPRPSIQKVIRTFFAACRSSYAEALPAIYAYERQTPEVSETKMRGLKEHYGIEDSKTLSFFEVHKEADIHHRKVLEELIDGFAASDRPAALKSARSAAVALWDFLSDMGRPAPAA